MNAMWQGGMEQKSMHLPCLVWVAVLLAIQLAAMPVLADNGQFTSVGDIRSAMYKDQKSFGGCYKLLNATGPIGCAAPTQKRVQAVLVKLEDIQGTLTEPRAVLVSSQQAQSYIKQLQQQPDMLQYVKAVLVYNSGRPADQSAASTFPTGGEYAPYSSGGAPSSYIWNPYGSDVAYHYLPIPVFQLADSLTSETLWRAQYNARNGFEGSMHWLEAELSMQAEQPDSVSCINAGTCWPLGGFNVWSAMPPLPTNTTSGLPQHSGKPVTLVLAQVDSNGLFHDSVQAADAPLSGLIAMLAAMNLLAQANQTTTYTRQLVFGALSGEPWGYMGSKRMLWDLSRSSTSGTDNPYLAGLSLQDVEQVIEIGQVGRAFNNITRATKLYVHTQPTGGVWGDATQLVSALTTAATASALDANLTLSPANPSNPGIPPSSLFSFLRAKPSIAGAVITEFDSQYINPYYHSSYDDGEVVDAEPMAAAAVLIARTLHDLAGPVGAPALNINVTEVTGDVLELAFCMMLDSPGMSCPLATQLLNPDYQITDQYVSYAVKHYLGVLQFIHPNPQEPFYKKTIYRFLWNYMGQLSAISGPGQECAFSSNQCPAGQECIGWKGGNNRRPQLMGHCYNTTVRYHPSISTHLDYTPSDSSAIGLTITNASSAWESSLGWPADPIWTESNWPATTPFVRVFQRDPASTEWSIFGGGVAACVTTALLCWWGKSRFEKHLKPH